MNVTFVSVCEGDASKRSQAVLDSYAVRIADRTWQTNITEDGLTEVFNSLRAVASRNSAVACYRSYGRGQMKRVWTVGSKERFGPDGFAIGTRKREQPKTNAVCWLRLGELICRIAGLSHDWGKANLAFQSKLDRAVDQQPSKESQDQKSQKDAIRHEWLSNTLLDEFLFPQDIDVDDSGKVLAAWNAAWRKAADREWKPSERLEPFTSGLTSVENVIRWLVVSHHRLAGPFKDDRKPEKCDPSSHVSAPSLKDDYAPKAAEVGFSEIKPSILEARRLYTELKAILSKLPPLTPDSLSALTTRCRAALIMADHSVSSQTAPDNQPSRMLHANTKRVEGRKGYRLDQSLDFHISQVSASAADCLKHMTYWHPRGLNRETTSKILTPSGAGRFQWQDVAHAVVSIVAKNDHNPILVINAAATGMGKTRANARIATCLAVERKRAVRFCAGLNLRTLTLQTGTAWQKEWKVTEHDLACVIGDTSAKKLFDNQQNPDATSVHDLNTDGNEYENDFLVAYGDNKTEMPIWLEMFVKEKKHSKPILNSPVLVSTIDFLIDAGNPGRLSNQAFAMLRLIGSTLILDEIDSYDPPALIAICRLVRTAAMLGSDVILSSATQPKPLVNALVRAFRSGAKAYEALSHVGHDGFDDTTSEAKVILVSNRGALDISASPSSIYAQQMLEWIYETDNHTKRFSIVSSKAAADVGQDPKNADHLSYDWLEKMVSPEIDKLHQMNKWRYQNDPNRPFISFGLIRVANVKTAINLARRLADNADRVDTQMKICCYHSNEMRIVRHFKERQLDTLLARHPRPIESGGYSDGNDAINTDPDIQKIIDQNYAKKNVIFIVIATPVEEIGRDHDFDWGIIEPSGGRSIVQTAGRINRHRLVIIPAGHYNVAVLNMNRKALAGKKPSFQRPGLETERHRYPDHCLEKLILRKSITTACNIFDARLIFDEDINLAKIENDILEKMLVQPLNTVLAEGNHITSWMCASHYTNYALRSPNNNVVVFFYKCGAFIEKPNVKGNTHFFQSKMPDMRARQQPPDNATWLGYDDSQLREDPRHKEIREACGLSEEDAYEVSIETYQNQTKNFEWFPAFGFNRND